MLRAPLLLLFAPAAFAQAPAPEPLTAETIMARVAENQDRAEALRSSYVYHQDVLVRMNHNNGKLAHEHHSIYIVTPTDHGIQKTRTYFLGKYVQHGKMVEYHNPEVKPQDHISVEIDGEVCSDLANDLSDDKKTKDGIGKDLFPLTADEQKHYTFRLAGAEDYRGEPVYRVLFEPKPNQEDNDWAGEALVDQKEFQPVVVTTHLAFKIPMAVRVLLGTNVQHLGFKVTYKKFDEGVWFPVSYGGEFKVRALFFYARKIGISMRNNDFARAAVSSKVTFEAVQQ